VHRRQFGFPGDIDADGHVASVRQGKVHGIAYRARPGRDRERRLLAERQRAIGARYDGRLVLAQRDVNRRQRQGRPAVGIRQANAYATAAEARGHDHADRLVLDFAQRLRAGKHERRIVRRGCPRTHPVFPRTLLGKRRRRQ
jgi:hypothetical protein